MIEYILLGTTIVLSCIIASIPLKKAVKNGIYDGYNEIKWDLTEPETQKGLKMLANNVIKGGLAGGVKGAMPKIKPMDLLMMLGMKYLGGGDLGNILNTATGSAVNQTTQPKDSNKISLL